MRFPTHSAATALPLFNIQAALPAELLGIGLAFAVSAIAAMILIGLAPALRLVDRPGGRHTHARATPRVGGLAVTAGIVVSSFLFDRELLLSREAAAAGAFLILGVLDDVLRDRFHWMLKFAGQVAILAAWRWPLSSAELALVACFFILVNFYNFFDHADGLFLIALFPPALLLPGQGALIVASALVPVLLLNLMKRAFAGDAGSHALTFFIFATAFESAVRAKEPGDFDETGRLLFSMMLPIYDGAWVVLARVLHGIPPWRATHVHLNDRYLQMGFPRYAALTGTLLWSAAASIATATGTAGSSFPFTFGIAILVCALPALSRNWRRGTRP